MVAGAQSDTVKEGHPTIGGAGPTASPELAESSPRVPRIRIRKNNRLNLLFLVGRVGFEPTTKGLTIQRGRQVTRGFRKSIAVRHGSMAHSRRSHEKNGLENGRFCLSRAGVWRVSGGRLVSAHFDLTRFSQIRPRQLARTAPPASALSERHRIWRWSWVIVTTAAGRNRESTPLGARVGLPPQSRHTVRQGGCQLWVGSGRQSHLTVARRREQSPLPHDPGSPRSRKSVGCGSNRRRKLGAGAAPKCERTGRASGPWSGQAAAQE